MTKWLCENCYNNLDWIFEIKTILNVFKEPCAYCGKLGKYLVVIGEKEKLMGKEEINLEKMKFIAINYLTKELWEECIALNEPAIHAVIGMFKEEIIARLTCKVFVHEEGEYSFEWYQSWWQELRTKILPSWWLQRYPSLMEVKKKIKALATYPSLKINDFEHKSHIDFT